METQQIVLIAAVGLVIYCIPLIVALERGHPQRGAIVALNLLGGWTLVGWLGALVWAMTAVARPAPAAAEKTCPRCAEQVKAAAKICRFCGFEFQESGPAGPGGGAGRA